jgi:very-short-patch-repair endonuclease
LIENYDEIDDLKIDFKQDILNDYLKGNQKDWKQKLETSSQLTIGIENCDLKRIDRDIEITYPADKSLKQLKSDGQLLLNYLKQGNPLSGFKFTLRKPFVSKEIKERFYFTDEVRVNGSPCDTIQEFEDVLRDIELKQSLDDLSRIWKTEVFKKDLLSDRFNYFGKLCFNIEKLIEIADKAEKLRIDIERLFGINITPFDKTGLADNIEKAEYQSFLQLKSRLENLIPNLLNSIKSGTFSTSDMPNFRDALFFRHAQNEISKFADENYERRISDKLKENETKEKKLIAELASQKAWYKVVERLEQNRSIREHLTAWVMAAGKIGKTGKRALKARDNAQKEMEYCKNSVPCWIMPLYKVAETIKPEQGMYDYVIIDEASQLGPDAIFLLYISKNVIIVGDDKQTSPEHIGIDVDAMTPYIKRHLKGNIPFSDYYGTEYSFFDHARLFCDGNIVLREHFRCMPEIIEFSNKLFYAPEGKELYPLKQYSENRLEPLMTVYCSNGFIDGIGSRIINKPEAEKLADKIKELKDDKRYKGKTFGVITLQGNQQAKVIEDYLLKRIGEREYYERKIICGNSASFQGGERDIIFLSLVTAHNHNRRPLTKSEDERRFNVAVSRAKEQIWLFHSVELEDLINRDDLRYKLLDHFKNREKRQITSSPLIERKIGAQPEPFDSWFEVDVYNDIVREGLNVIPQYKVAKGKYRIDLVALFHDGTKVAIECDGDKWHGKEQYQQDIMRQKVLERCGWLFFRVRGYEYYTNRKQALKPFWEMITKIKNEINNEAIDNIETEKKVEFNSDTINKPLPESKEQISNPTITSKVTVNDNIEPVAEEADVSVNAGENSTIIRRFNLYNSGNYIMTTDKPLDADFSLEIKTNQKNGYLLQCYDSGYINKVLISVLLSRKIGQEYKNGFCKNGKLTYLKIIDSEKIIGIYFNENGIEKFKAHLTENISNRKQLHLQGYKVIYNDCKDIKYKVLPLKLHNDINRLVFSSFTAKGKAVNNSYYSNEWSILKQLNRLKLY